MKPSLIVYLLTYIVLECSGAITRIVVPNNNNHHLYFPQYAGIAQNGNPFPGPPSNSGNGDYQCVPSGSCPGGGGGGDDEIDIRIVTPVSFR